MLAGNTIGMGKEGVRHRNSGEDVRTSMASGNTIASESDGLGYAVE